MYTVIFRRKNLFLHSSQCTETQTDKGEGEGEMDEVTADTSNANTQLQLLQQELAAVQAKLSIANDIAKGTQKKSRLINN